MGARWGVNRTEAQIHALLYLAGRPLTAEDIAASLGVARSNVSTSLRELQNWKIVRMVHVLGDRRDHFESLQDVWEMFRLILDERVSREVEPTRALLERCLSESAPGPKLDAASRARLQALSDFFAVTSEWYAQVSRCPQAVLIRFLKMGAKALKLLRLMP